MTNEFPRATHSAENVSSPASKGLQPLLTSPTERPANSVTLLSAVGLLLCTVALMKRLDPNLLGRPAFETEPLSHSVIAIIFLICNLEMQVLLITGTTLLQYLIRRIAPQLAWLSSIPVAIGLGVAITIKFHVFYTLKNNLDFAMLKSLGGGSIFAAVGFMRAQILAFGPPVATAVGVACALACLLVLYGRKVSRWLDSLALVRECFRVRRLVQANVALVILASIIAGVAPSINEALSSYFSHSVYTLPAAFLASPSTNEFDSLVSTPSPAWRPSLAAWDSSRLERKNVLLIVLESARAEIQDATLNGVTVMPALRNVKGQSIAFISPGGMTGPAIRGIFTGAFSTREAPGISLLNRFRDLHYRTAIFSAQDEQFGKNRQKCGMDGADLFLDSTLFPAERRMYSWKDQAQLSMPNDVVAASFGGWLASSAASKPFFAYINIQEMHFPYFHEGLPRELTANPLSGREMLSQNKVALRETYLNAARAADHGIGAILGHLDRLHLREKTIVLIMGDHGEELFDHGYLGHGVNLSYESYGTVGKLLNSRWKVPTGPVATADTGAVLYNALLRSPGDAIPLNNRVLCYAGDPLNPAAIALATPQGLIRYNFKKRQWTRQERFGSTEQATEPDLRVIQDWQSFRAHRLAGQTE